MNQFQKSLSSRPLFYTAALLIATILIFTACSEKPVDSNQAQNPPLQQEQSPAQDWMQDIKYTSNSHTSMGIECGQCHTINGSDFQKRVSNDTCFACHGQNYETLAAVTDDLEPNPHAPYHYEDMECGLCHQPHGQSEVYCQQCHDFNWINELDSEKWAK